MNTKGVQSLTIYFLDLDYLFNDFLLRRCGIFTIGDNHIVVCNVIVPTAATNDAGRSISINTAIVANIGAGYTPSASLYR